MKIHSRNVGRKNQGMRFPKLRHFIPRLADGEVPALVLLAVLIHMIFLQKDHIPFHEILAIEELTSKITVDDIRIQHWINGSKNNNGSLGKDVDY